MRMYILRQMFTKVSTQGLFLLNDVRAGFTLEDCVRKLGPNGEGKIPKETAIPAGRYKVVLTMSERFKKILPLLLNVPFFEGVRLHGGNTIHDTEGCPLIASNRVLNKQMLAGNITDSIVSLLQHSKEEHWIEIINCREGMIEG